MEEKLKHQVISHKIEKASSHYLLVLCPYYIFPFVFSIREKEKKTNIPLNRTKSESSSHQAKGLRSCLETEDTYFDDFPADKRSKIACRDTLEKKQDFLIR